MVCAVSDVCSRFFLILVTWSSKLLRGMSYGFLAKQKTNKSTLKLRQLTWPQGANLATKLWGSAEDLYRTAGFVASTGLKIWPARLSIAEEEEEEEED